MQNAAKPLENAGITVIPIAVGDEADVKELEQITPDKNNIVEPPDDTTPDDLSKMIMDTIQTGA